MRGYFLQNASVRVRCAVARLSRIDTLTGAAAVSEGLQSFWEAGACGCGQPTDTAFMANIGGISCRRHARGFVGGCDPCTWGKWRFTIGGIVYIAHQRVVRFWVFQLVVDPEVVISHFGDVHRSVSARWRQVARFLGIVCAMAWRYAMRRAGFRCGCAKQMCFVRVALASAGVAESRFRTAHG